MSTAQLARAFIRRHEAYEMNPHSLVTLMVSSDEPALASAARCHPEDLARDIRNIQLSEANRGLRDGMIMVVVIGVVMLFAAKFLLGL